MPRNLSPKQQKFVELYAACGNATESARQAGYKEPNKQGPANLVKMGIKTALDNLTAGISSNRIADAQERQEYWTALMRGEIQGDPEMIKIGIKASELLGRTQQDFIERVEHSLGPIAPDWKALLKPMADGD